MKGFILAAGFGTRLWPLTEDRTKPAIPFLKRPLIAYSVDYLTSFGITDIIVNLHHQPESIKHALAASQPQARIRYSLEDTILGTSGALDPVRELLSDDDFVVINGKIVTNINLTEVVQAHRQNKAIATLVLRKNSAFEHFSIVEVNDRNRITRFAGFPEQRPDATQAESEPPLMFTGIQVLSPRILDYVPRGIFSHSTIHVYPKAIEAGETVMGYVSAGDWCEMSTLDRYLDASLIFIRAQGASVVSGLGCSIAPSAVVQDSVLWDNVTVEAGARVRRAVLGDKVRIPPDSVIDSAVVVRREFVGEIERGDIVGDNLIVALR
jgi:NDP-sugar pyrophosphorylase family protein